MGDSLIGRTAGFDPVSPGSSPGPPAKSILNLMLCLIKLLFIFMIQNTLLAKPNIYEKIFQETLLKYNVVYDSLGDYKAGAICVPFIEKNYDLYAVGFSYNMFEKKNAIALSLSGCKEMKKKLISYQCKCEIIYE